MNIKTATHLERLFRPTDENRLLANIIESSDIIVYSRDREGIIISWNSAAERLFGYTKEEILGKPHDILLAKGQKEIKKVIENAYKGIIIRSIESIHITKDQREIPIGMKITPIKDELGAIIGVSIIARDLRREVHFREKELFLARVSHLLGSSLQYKRTLTALAKLLVPRFADWCAIHMVNDDGSMLELALTHSELKKHVWLNKTEAQKKDTKYLEFGPMNVIQSGKPIIYSPVVKTHMLLGKNAKQFSNLIHKMQFSSLIVVPLTSRKKVLGAITLGSTKKYKQFTYEDFALAKELGMRAGQAIDNSKLYSEVQAQLKERKQFIAELKKSRDQLEIIFENISDGISVHDADGNLIFANEAMARSGGYRSLSDMIESPKAWLTRYDISDQSGSPIPLSNLPVSRAQKGEESPQEIIHFVDKKTGESRWALMKAQSVRDELQRVQLVVTIIHDITEIQEQEARKDEFISMASHELKTPLTSLSVYLHLLHSKVNDKKLVPFLDKITNQTRKLTKLVEDLLDISKIQSGKLDYHMESMNLTEVVEDIAMVLQETTQKHSIRMKQSQPVMIYGDKNRINQVATNLLVNAIKYSPHGGIINVTVTQKDGHAFVSISDTGIGIAKEDQSKIFTRLYQGSHANEKTFPGLGIGLYIAADIIKRHKGTIQVESVQGKGSTFTFTLPLISNYETTHITS